MMLQSRPLKQVTIGKVTQSTYADYTGLTGQWYIHINNHLHIYKKSLQGCLDYVDQYHKPDSINLTIDCRGA